MTLTMKNDRKVTKEDVEAKMKSLQTVGLLSPIIVNKDGLVTAGRIRFQAMQALGWEMKEGEHYIVKDNIDDKVISFVENFERKNLTLAEELKHLEILEKETKDIAELGNAIGKDANWIKRRLNLKKLCKEARELLKHNDKGWTIGHFEFLATLSKAEQEKCCNSWKLEGLGVQKFKNEVIKGLAFDLGSLPWEDEGCGECTFCTARKDDEVLFEEMKQDKRCSNREHVKKGQEAWIEEIKGKGIYLLSERYTNDDDEDIIPQTNWDYAPEGAKESDKGVEKGIIINGEDMGEEVLFTKIKGSTNDSIKEKKTLKQLKEQKMRQRWRYVGEAIVKLIVDSPKPLCKADLVAHLMLIFDSKSAVEGRWDYKTDKHVSIIKTQNIGIASLQEVVKKERDVKVNATWELVKPEMIKEIRNGYDKKTLEEYGEVMSINVNSLWEEAMTELPDPKSWAVREHEEKANAKTEKKAKAKTKAKKK